MIFKVIIFFILAFQLSMVLAANDQIEITTPLKCSSKIGEGGNLQLSGNVKLLGKCQGNAISPAINGGAIVFSVPAKPTPVLKNRAMAVRSINDRSELAFTNTPILFNQDYLIDFKVKVLPESDITEASYYILQVWQGPKYAPIFGVRIGKGTKDRAAFIVRNPENHVAGLALKRTTLSPDYKHYQIYFNVEQTMKGNILIKEDNREIAKWSGIIGYPEPDHATKSLLLKFGIYKGQEPTKSFLVVFKDITLKQI